MITFIKAQAASLMATIVDFSIYIILVEGFHAWYLAASIAGTISGGVANFMLGRKWVFRSTDRKIPVQAIKYMLVWGGNLLLVSGGVYALKQFGGVNYIAAKVVVSIVVGFSYNYLLQKRFVFK